MITYNVERWNDMCEEFKPFIEPHWRELGIAHQDVECILDWASYKKLDDEGHLHVVTVRDDGALIGYHISILRTMLHYATTLHAICDLYYLLPKYRKSEIGIGMFKYAEMRFAELGVKKIITGTKLHLYHDKLFLGLGYQPIETIFYKKIGD